MPTLAVIIPSGDDSRSSSLENLLEDLQKQTIKPDEIEVVRGVSPNGRARNVGLERTTSDYLVFLDDDVRLGSPDVLEKLLLALEEPGVGLSGTAQLLPPDSSHFQLRSARQIPRSQSEVVDQITDSDMVTTQCCATSRKTLLAVGNFHDKILRGVDPELRHRYRQANLRIVIAPGIWHYHPMPSSWKALLKMAYRNGYSSAFAQKFFPETVLYNPEGHVDHFQARPPLYRRLWWRARGVFRAIFHREWMGLGYDLAYAIGVVRCLAIHRQESGQ